MSKNINLVKSDIGNLFEKLESIAKETKLEEKKRKDYVETTETDLSSLFSELEKVSQETKKLNEKDKDKLNEFANIFTKLNEEYPEDLPSDVEPKPDPEPEKDYEEPPEDDPTDDVSDKGSLQGWIEKKADTQPKDIVEQIVGQLDDMRYQTEVKEELDEIEKLRKEFEQYKTVLQNQITKNLATSSGGGEVRLEFLDDVDRDTAKVNGKFLKFDSSSGKFVGDDVSISDETIQDVIGNMVSSNTESGITVTYQDADGTLDFTIGTLNQDTTGNAATATALETARTIHGVSFDGTGNIDLTEVIQDTVGAMFSSNTETDITVTYQDGDGTIDLVVSDISGNSATATALETARTIGGVSFDGTANINLPGVNTSGNQDTTGNAATATALETARTIHGVSFDGTSNIDLTEVVQDTVGAMFSSNTETGVTVTYQDGDGTIDLVVGTLNQDTTGNAATATALANARNIGGVSFDGTANINLPGVNTSGDQDTSGNAATATALATARTINGTSFDGTANITVTSAAGTLTGNTLNSGVTASSLTSVGTLTTLTVDNVIVNGTTIGHTDDTDLITLADGSVTIAGNLTVSGTTTTVNQVEVNVTNAFVFEGETSDANETTLRVNDPSADRKVSIQDKTGTIALISGFKLDGTDSSKTNEGDFLVLNTSDDENDRLLFEDGTSDPIAVLASHGITLSGQGWNAFQFENP